MEILVDGNRSSLENWTRAQKAPLDVLPALSDGDRVAAQQLHMSPEMYARSLYAVDLERSGLEQRAMLAGRAVERLAAKRIPGVQVTRIEWNTLAGKFRFGLEYRGNAAEVVAVEDVLSNLLESGSAEAESCLERVIEYAVPTGWTMRAS